jgi:DnaJ homolog subfamily C member 17
LNDKIRVQEARKQRYAAYDAKRKTMMEELDKSERDFKKAKTNEAQEKAARAIEEERIKEENRRLMRERIAEKLRAAMPPSPPRQSPDVKGKAKDDAPPGGFYFRFW